MLGLGSRLGGDVDLMRNWLDGFRNTDNRHLYSLRFNNFLGWEICIDGEDYLTTCRVGGGRGYTTHVRSSFAFVDAEEYLEQHPSQYPCGLYCCHSEISPTGHQSRNRTVPNLSRLQREVGEIHQRMHPYSGDIP